MNLTALLNFESSPNDAQIQSSELDAFAATSLKVFIEQTYKKMAPSFVIVLSCRSKIPLRFFLNILQLVFQLVYHMNVQLVYFDRYNPKRMEGARKHNLILVDSFEAFRDLDIISYTRDYDTNEYYQIFLMQQDRYIYQDMKLIFNYCWKNNIVNCNVQYQNRLGEIYVNTYFPYRPHKCNNTEPQIINQFIGDKWMNTTFFHYKLTNFYGCPLVVAARDVPPYSYITKAEDGSVIFKGFELDLMKFLAKKMNFTLNLRTGSIDDRSIPINSGALKLLREDKVHAVIGYYRRRPGKDYEYSCTFPHYQNILVAVLYLPKQTLNTFEMLLFPYSNIVWYFLFMTLFVTFMVIIVIRKSQPESISLFLLIACALGTSIKLDNKLQHSSSIYFSWLWSSFLMRTIYAGLLFHLIRYQNYSFIPNTLEEAANGNFYAVMNQFTYSDINQIRIYRYSENRTSIVLPSHDEFEILSYLEKSTSKYRYAVVSVDFLTYFIDQKKKAGVFHIIQEIVMQQQLTIYLRKHSFLINQLEREIIYIRCVGLIKFWEQKYINTKYSLKKQLYLGTSFVQGDLWSIYAVCGGFYVIAFIMILIEILSVKIKFLKRLFE